MALYTMHPLLYAQDRVEWGVPEISTRVRGGPWVLFTCQIIGVRSPEYIGYGYGSAVRTSALPSFGTGCVPAGYAATLAAATFATGVGDTQSTGSSTGMKFRYRSTVGDAASLTGHGSTLAIRSVAGEKGIDKIN